ncbi:ABC transporter permease [Haloferula sp. BvORR071]|uniref:ABC transporter permease n=1 Tax=Haloferula sp. BvORR071 TaxID=1396141 RepID=UPI0005572086|nr:ABC transporter permease [Haloferula sp. BvORR071]
MKAYFLRRLLLIPLTLLGITALVFSINRTAKGGPVERSLASLVGGEGKRSRAQAGSSSITPAQVLDIEEKVAGKNRDKSILRAYGEWLGVVPRDIEKKGQEFPKGATEVEMAVPGTIYTVTVTRNGDQASFKGPEGVELSDWQVRLRSPEEQAKRWDKWMGIALPAMPEYRAVLYKPAYDGLFQGSLGMSEKYQEPVASMILQRMPVSLYFGVIEILLIYGICLPLGILKAIKHRTWVDNVSSVAIFTGYSIPGYALGSLMVVVLGAQLGWFPIRGFTGDDFDTLSLAGKIKDLASHTFMPLLCYLVGSFAMMTMLVKNNLMDNLAADYVRTATAKGVSYPRAVFGHAFRNSIIPIATTFGDNLAYLIAGSVLIEKIFDIDGFGLLQYSAVLERDEAVMLGVLFIAAVLTAFGKIISDLAVVLVDPRVSYK